MAGAMSASVGDLRAFITNSRRDKTCTNVEERERPDWSDVRREGGPSERASGLQKGSFVPPRFSQKRVHTTGSPHVGISFKIASKIRSSTYVVAIVRMRSFKNVFRGKFLGASLLV